MSLDIGFVKEEYALEECDLLTTDQKYMLAEEGILTCIQLLNQPSDLVMQWTGLEWKEYEDLVNAILSQHRSACCTLVDMLPDLQKTVLTGIKKLDDLFDGGLIGGEILEICGKSGTGKSQMCMSIAAQVCHRQKESSVVYIDLKNDFVPQRFLELCDGSVQGINRIHVIRETKIKDVIDTIEEYERKMCLGQTNFISNIRVLILDSIPMALYPCGDSSKIYQERVTQALTRLAVRFNAIIILTNHTILVQTKHSKKNKIGKHFSEEESQDKLRPALGNFWSRFPHFRLLLSQKDGLSDPLNFQAKLIKSTRTKQNITFDFKISKSGIE